MILLHKLMFETEDLLSNPVLTRGFVEEYGKYQGYFRIVIRKFKIYYEISDNEIIIQGALFPGQD